MESHCVVARSSGLYASGLGMQYVYICQLAQASIIDVNVVVQNPLGIVTGGIVLGLLVTQKQGFDFQEKTLM